MILPRYPVYVISKGRAATGTTARFLQRDGVPFRLVVEPQEADEYAAIYGDVVERLPFSNLGQGGIPARNWVWDHAIATGAERHWILDDNIRQVRRLYRDKRIPCASGPVLACIEDFSDRYENVAIAGMTYTTFARPRIRMPAFYTNQHVYSCLLILNTLEQRWRGRYNEDTDLCLQVLADGWCTVLVNMFGIDKANTMTMNGGNTDELYRGDGRLKMARSLERVWPGVVRTDRRYGRPQHVVKNAWRNFDTPLRLKPGVELPTGPNEYGLELRAARDVRSAGMQRLLDESRESRIMNPDES